MSNENRACIRFSLLCYCIIFSVLVVASARGGGAQDAADRAYFARRQSFGLLAAYSNDSSHILMGVAEQRKLLNFGVSYSRRLFVDHYVNWQYDGELLPVVLNSDPVQVTTTTYTNINPPLTYTSSTSTPTLKQCENASGSGSVPGQYGLTYTFVSTCTRRWVIGESISPVGFQWNFMPRWKIQPLVEGHGGYMYSTQTIPTSGAGSFNFTFDGGLGLELYQRRSRSLRVEYRFHHISNHGTAYENPGIDNSVVQVSYMFGR